MPIFLKTLSGPIYLSFNFIFNFKSFKFFVFNNIFSFYTNSIYFLYLLTYLTCDA